MDYPKIVPNVALSGGKFTDGDPSNGIPASLVPAQWLNSVTDELLNVLSEGGIDPDEAANTQVRDAILAVISAQFTGSNQSLLQNGYQMFPGGFIVQMLNAGFNNNQTITFPITFPNAFLCCAVMEGNVDGTPENAHIMGYRDPTASGMTVTALALSGTNYFSSASIIVVGY